MQKRSFFVMLFIFSLSVSLTVVAESGSSRILGELREVFHAFNLSSQPKMEAVLQNFINQDFCWRTFDGHGLNRNDICVEGIPIYGSGHLFQKSRFILDGYDITITDNTAAVSGYVKGWSVIKGHGTKKGPWRLSSCWYEYRGRWYIEHLSLSKLNIPRLEYYPQLPTNYKQHPERKWPLIVFLHGVGERGGTLDDLRKMNHSVPLKATTTPKFPFVVVSPLCPTGYTWAELPYSIDELLDEVILKYHIDPDRVYLTGLSLGGIGTWSLAMQFPERFAAIAPVCGNADPDKVGLIQNIPVWAFHGAKDPVIAIKEEMPAVKALKACGGNVKYTIYPDVAHDAWNKAYNTPELYEWFLRHKKQRAIK